MPRYATLTGNVVDTVYLYQPPETLGAIEVPDDVFAGHVRDGDQWVAPAPVAPVPTTISRRQCAAELFARGYLTNTEALAMAASGSPPAAVEAALSSLPEPDQTFARMDVMATTYDRTNARVIELVSVFEPGATDTVVDEFFLAAAVR